LITVNSSYGEVTVVEKPHWIDIESQAELLSSSESNLVILSVDVENIHTEPLTIMKFSIVDENNRVFSSSFYTTEMNDKFGISFGDCDIAITSVNPGLVKNFVMCFETPKNSSFEQILIKVNDSNYKSDDKIFPFPSMTTIESKNISTSIENTESSFVPTTEYKNQQYGFTMKVPTSFSITENYHRESTGTSGIVLFEDGVIDFGISEITKKNIVDEENYYQELTSEGEEWCVDKSFQKDGFICEYYVIDTQKTTINGLNAFSAVDRSDFTEADDSIYEDSTNICRFYHVQDGDQIWELFGCVSLLVSDFEENPFAVQLGTGFAMEIITNSLESFTKINSESSPYMGNVGEGELEKELERQKQGIVDNSEGYMGNVVPEELGIASFVDKSKDPQYYIDRYNNEPDYKDWFDNNYPQYDSIEQAVGLEITEKIPDWVKNTMQWYLDGAISEDEMISAISFLVKEGIVKVD